MTHISYGALIQTSKRKPRKKDKLKLFKSCFNGTYARPEILKGSKF